MSDLRDRLVLLTLAKHYELILKRAALGGELTVLFWMVKDDPASFAAWSQNRVPDNDPTFLTLKERATQEAHERN